MDQRQRVTIRFLNPELEIIGHIDQYTSLQYLRRFKTYNTFELHLGKHDKELIKDGNYVLFEDDLESLCCIREFSVNRRGYTKEVIIKGFCPRFDYFSRQTLPPSGKDEDTYNTEVESIILGLMRQNCAAPENSNRKYENLILETSQNRGDKITFSTRYKILKDEIESLSNLSRLGTYITLDHPNKKVRFGVRQGIDRSYENGVRPHYIFSKDLDRVIEMDYTESSIDYKNCAYVAGQGEGKDREVLILGNDLKGYDRRETYFDARDIGENSETTLEDRGKLRLSEYPKVKTFSAEVITADYRKANGWDLGDFITVVDEETGTQEDRQILEVKEIYENGKQKIEPVFGEKLKLPKDLLKKLPIDAVSYQGKQGTPGQPGSDGKTPNFRLDESGNLYAIYE